ncbi:MAG TPA: asparagine synthase (glutamine-hydrolyzing) [Bryobacteraceae bacterium]|nr:asparagine synthase (glutamine-hydrolyzing) [Bryobacteraceae bacterium]
MCGIAGCFGNTWQVTDLLGIQTAQRHRGPDDGGTFFDLAGRAALAHSRLSILDLSTAGRQPMSNSRRNLWIAFNGEIYNYLELRKELRDYPYSSRTDTEVILAAYERWGDKCLSRLHGMFAFLIWDMSKRRLFAARDRFGVKPLYYHVRSDGSLFVASETRAIRSVVPEIQPDPVAWATYLSSAASDYSERTFWSGIQSLAPGHSLSWDDGKLSTSRWYDLAARSGVELDTRPADVVMEEYSSLLEDSVRLRFRSDVPVGVNLSGGLDSSLLLGLVHRIQGANSDVDAYTFVTGDENYDELPWVQRMLARTRHESVVCRIGAEDVPALTETIHRYQDEPFGGVPTLAYAQLFREARNCGTKVLLDGQGLDEQWAGYDYYASGSTSPVQGTGDSPVRPACLTQDFAKLVEQPSYVEPFPDALRNRQYRDIRYGKIPRALRFNDRVSMHASTELREPFLDHRLVELALRQRPHLKMRDGVRKWLPRQIAAQLLPDAVAGAPKRPVQTPQREWLRGPLRPWAVELIEDGLRWASGSWLDSAAVRNSMQRYFAGQFDNSFFMWQWISIGLMKRQGKGAAAA